MRTTEEAIKEDLEILSTKIWDDECYHWKFDSTIEQRLYELDPKYMEALDKAYEDSDMNRRYA